MSALIILKQEICQSAPRNLSNKQKITAKRTSYYGGLEIAGELYT